MKFFADLGKRVASKWRRHGFRDAAFADVAAAVLTERAAHERVDPMTIVRWVMTSRVGPQTDLGATFGQPPISVFESERFFVQILFWLDGTTAVHDHAFSGAFQVLSGSSIHTVCQFTPKAWHGRSLAQGHLAVEKVELLRAGDVRRITAGRAFVHSLFHCERPSVSLVVRTRRAVEGDVQLEYSRSGLAFDARSGDASSTRRLQVFELLQRWDPTAFEVEASRVARGDLPLAVQLVRRLHERMSQRQLEGIVEALGRRHRGLGEAILAFVGERRRERHLASLRQGVVDPDLRLFLALLLNVTDRRDFVSLVRSTRPGADVSAAMEMWIGSLFRLESMRRWARAPDAAGRTYAESTDYARIGRLGRLMLEGVRGSALSARMREGSKPNVKARGDVARLCSDLRQSLVLGAQLRS